ncbi:Exopolyphosphatase [Coemansia sp. RSA 2673]|nr:Exopolyphosphatase [Coemansia sp. RSA 2673]
MSTFSAFVRALGANTAKLRNRVSFSDRLTIVLGNESADLDSMASSISLAYLLSHGSSNSTIIPVINVSKQDLALRPDCALLVCQTLEASGGAIDDLAFIDDFDMLAYTDVDVWLVDHNSPGSRQTALEPLVCGIIDHHFDEGKCTDAKVRQIEVVGSCCTLVAQRFRDQGIPVDSALAKLMLAPILIDTSNLSLLAQRATDKDAACVAWLASQVSWTSKPATDDCDGDAGDLLPAAALDVSGPSELYAVLDKLKGMVAHLSAYDLLRKDYKQWQIADFSGALWTVGISSISYPLKKWLKRDGYGDIEQAVGDWMELQGLDLAIVMTRGKAKAECRVKTFGRQLVVAFSARILPAKQQQVLDRLRASDILGLKDYAVDSASSGSPQAAHFFTQSQTSSSRKQVFPVVKSVIEGS